jgi:hypothetical protein
MAGDNFTTTEYRAQFLVQKYCETSRVTLFMLSRTDPLVSRLHLDLLPGTFPGTFQGAILISTERLGFHRFPLLASLSSLVPVNECLSGRLFPVVTYSQRLD